MTANQRLIKVSIVSLSLDQNALGAHEATALAQEAILSHCGHWTCWDHDKVMPRYFTASIVFSASLDFIKYQNCMDTKGSS